MTEKTVEENRERELIREFVLNTNRSIFLTGKAGTGKTTLLKELLEDTDKNYLIAAPTGVAAINAGGVTLHSLFLFPFQTYLPERNPNLDANIYYDATGLVKHQKFNRAKLNLFLELELLVIDEISMVRVDLMDAIDVTLRRVRKNSQPFGGVQLLVIGDLYQLSPVVRQESQAGLMHYYASPYFFDSQAWKKTPALTIELKKVYRQEDQAFIDMLNSVRDGKKDQTVIAKLNEQYVTELEDNQIITLTTHNRQADSINASQLAALETKTIELKASINGKFPENSYPTPEKITLKKGAQVMFIRNHPEGLYYNGKIGTITSLSTKLIKIKGLDDNLTIIVEPVEWKNTKYELDAATDKIVTNDVGSFEQYPLRLAWAVTVHKSQGLTFDELVLDVAKTFAAGQLYVALSRCRSLEGLTLLSKVKPENVITDQRIVSYYESAAELGEVDKELAEAKAAYEQYKLLRAFRHDKLLAYMDQWQDVLIDKDIDGKANCQLLINNLVAALRKLEGFGRSFEDKMTRYFLNENVDKDFVKERVSKAISYFTEQLHKEILTPIVKHGAEYTVKKNTKTYLAQVEAVEIAVGKFITKLYKVEYLGAPAFEGEQTHKPSEIKTKPVKRVVGGTYDITYDMHKAGKSIVAIAKERGLSAGTIETHLARLIKDQRISVFDLMDDKKVEKALVIAQQHNDLNFTELIKKMPFKMSFGELRWITSYRDILSG